jgi:hypothetical protein
MKKTNKNLFTDRKEISFSRYLVSESDVKLKAVINKPGSKDAKQINLVETRNQ